jgi:hypothetical protein
MRGLRLGSLLVLLGGACHSARYDAAPASPTQLCRACGQQAQDACKLDTDRPGYYCPRDYQECAAACDAADENQICVVQTRPRVAATAQAPAHEAPPPVAVAKTAPSARGECDNSATWKLEIVDVKGRAGHCTALDEIPRQVSFRIERRHDEYALRDLVPAPGWSDGFAIANKPDECGVELRRDHDGDGARPRHMSVVMTEKDGEVIGTFHYIEEMPKPAACELDAKVTGILIAPAPRPAPPQQTTPSKPPPQPEMPPVQRGSGRIR